jgi:hypothetical protein
MRNCYLSILSLIVIILTSSNIACAGLKSDTLFLKPFSQKISTRILFGHKGFSLSIGSKLPSSLAKITYKPNSGIVGGVGITYRNILIGYFFNVSGTELNDRKFGKTHISDYQLNITNRFFYISGFHRSYRGFYVFNPNESYPDWKEGMNYPQRKDIEYVTKGFETIINLKPRKYSLNASLKFTEHQLRSVLAPLVYASYSYSMVSADSSLIPSHLSSSFFDGKELLQINFTGWTLMPGLSYTYVNGKWFFNPMIFSGFSYLQKDLRLKDLDSENYKNYYFRVSSRCNFGYNSKKFFTGAFVEWNEMFLPEKNLMIKTESLNLMLMFGFRF